MLRVAFWMGIAGAVASLTVHLATFTAYAPPGGAIVLHIGIFVAFVPVLVAMKDHVEARGYEFNDFRSQRALQKELFGLLSGWQKTALVVLLVYAMVNIGVGFFSAVGDAEPEFSFRMFSGHWLLFYVGCAVFAHRLLALRDEVVAPREQ